MPARFTFRRALLGAALALVGASTAGAQPITSLTVFGDSFSDTGNGDILAAMFGAPDQTPTPPYAPGRASNGIVWVDKFAALTGQPAGAVPSLVGGNNFAIGTARTGTTGVLGLPLGVLSQVGLFSGMAPPPFPAVPARVGDPTGLYVLFAGANDLFDAVLGPPAQYGAAVNQAVENIATATTALYARGARRFLIPNLPNVGLAPLALGTPASPVLGTLTDQFNMLLGARLATLQGALPGTAIYDLSLDTLFDNILYDAASGGARYGLTNTTVPCLPPPFGPGPVSCDVSVFADGEHPTAKVHGLIADAAFQRVAFGADVAALPEPATVALLGGGLLVMGAVGAVRRKRAA